MPLADFSRLSDRQRFYIRKSFKSPRPIQFAYGSVRSGKNFSEAIRLATYLRFEPFGHANSDFIFCGASIKAVYRILLRDIFELVGPDNFVYHTNDGSGRIFNRNFYSFGFTKANSHEPIRGMTAGGLAGTEATFCHPDFFDESNLRLSLPGAKAFWDTNPGPPSHYLKKILDDPTKAAEIQAYQFLLRDNPFVMQDTGFLRKVHAMYPPGSLLHRRMILGEWAMAEGRIFDTFADRHTIKRFRLPLRFDKLMVGIDYGTQNATVFLLIGLVGRTYYVIREYYYSGREAGVQQTSGQYLQDLLAFIRGERIDSIYADPAAAHFIAEMSQAKLPIKDTDNAVLPGIQTINTLLAEDRLFICEEGCPRLLDGMASYAWDTKAQERGIERPLKVDDHALDGLRYCLHSHEDSLDVGSVWDELEREFLHAA